MPDGRKMFLVARAALGSEHKDVTLFSESVVFGEVSTNVRADPDFIRTVRDRGGELFNEDVDLPSTLSHHLGSHRRNLGK